MKGLDKVAEYRKAIAALAVPALLALAAALTPDSPGGGSVTASEWVAIAIAALGTASVVAAVPNRPNRPKG